MQQRAYMFNHSRKSCSYVKDTRGGPDNLVGPVEGNLSSCTCLPCYSCNFWCCCGLTHCLHVPHMHNSNPAYQASDHTGSMCDLCIFLTVPGFLGISHSMAKHFKAHGCLTCARWCINIEHLLLWCAAAVLPTLLAPNTALAEVTVCTCSLLAHCWHAGC